MEAIDRCCGRRQRITLVGFWHCNLQTKKVPMVNLDTLKNHLKEQQAQQKHQELPYAKTFPCKRKYKNSSHYLP